MSNFTTENILDQIFQKAKLKHTFPNFLFPKIKGDLGTTKLINRTKQFENLVEQILENNEWSLREATEHIYYFWEVHLYTYSEATCYLPAQYINDPSNWRNNETFKRMEAVREILQKKNIYRTPLLSRILVFHLVTNRSEVDSNFINEVKKWYNEIISVGSSTDVETRFYHGKSRGLERILNDSLNKFCPTLLKELNYESKIEGFNKDRPKILSLQKFNE